MNVSPVNIDLNPHQLREILRILDLFVPNIEVWAFGSRVRWTAKPYSDLDLVLITKTPLTLEQDASLRDAFENSTLPIRVDFVDWAATSESFRRIIEQDKIILKKAAPIGPEVQWPVMTLEDCLAELIDYRGKTPRKIEAGIPLITAKVIKGGRIEAPTEFIAPQDYDEWMRRGIPQPGDVVLTTEAPLGEVAQLGSGRFALAQRVITLRGKPNLLDNAYLRYLLQTEDIQEQLAARATGTTVIGIKQSELRRLSIRLPPLAIQRSASRALKLLDDRITLLHETNTTLEAIAQALFKSWFVDFDPVRAKQQGLAPAGMDEATAALFPDSLENSALGLVPKGWRVEPVGQVVEGIYDGPHATPPEADVGPVFLGIKNLTGSGLDFNEVRHIAEGDFAQWTRRVMPRPGDIVFSYEATLGFFALIPPGLRCCLGRRLALIRPRAEGADGHFLLHQFISAPFQRLLERHTIHGATVNRIALKQFPSYQVLNPPDALRAAFDLVAAALWARIHENQAQAATLATLRDALLPRLISGQLRLPEAEALIEETA